MANAAPFSIPVDVHYQNTVSLTLVSPWVVNLSIVKAQEKFNTEILFQQKGARLPGLYFVYFGIWNYVASLDAINSYVVNGGKVDVYADLTTTIQIPAGSQVFQNGVLVDVTQIVPMGPNVLWAVVTTANASSGTLTSASLTMPPDFSVAGSPITQAGTFSVTRIVQNANTVLAGPSTGSAATPSYRALTPSDIPTLTPTQLPDVLDEGMY